MTLHLAFVLHTRPYKDSSLLVELFTKEKGKISGIAKNARRPGSSLKNALQLFQPILVDWKGKSDLVTILDAEVYELLPRLTGERCWCGLYLNELLMYLISRADPFPAVFQLYYQTVMDLAESKQIEMLLRYFEKSFLAEIGYGLELSRDKEGKHIDKDAAYQFICNRHTQLFQKIDDRRFISPRTIFSGQSILALHHQQLDEHSIKDAKRLLRQTLVPLLGNRQLKSREMFRALMNSKLEVEETENA